MQAWDTITSPSKDFAPRRENKHLFPKLLLLVCLPLLGLVGGCASVYIWQRGYAVEQDWLIENMPLVNAAIKFTNTAQHERMLFARNVSGKEIRMAEMDVDDAMTGLLTQLSAGDRAILDHPFVAAALGQWDKTRDARATRSTNVAGFLAQSHLLGQRVLDVSFTFNQVYTIRTPTRGIDAVVHISLMRESFIAAFAAYVAARVYSVSLDKEIALALDDMLFAEHLIYVAGPDSVFTIFERMVATHPLQVALRLNWANTRSSNFFESLTNVDEYLRKLELCQQEMYRVVENELDNNRVVVRGSLAGLIASCVAVAVVVMGIWYIVRAEEDIATRRIAPAPFLPTSSSADISLQIDVPPTTVKHVVRPGESLAQVAQKYKVSANEIRASNITQSLPTSDSATLPMSVSTVLVPGAHTSVQHALAHGESLSHIAQRYGVTSDSVRESNPTQRLPTSDNFRLGDSQLFAVMMCVHIGSAAPISDVVRSVRALHGVTVSCHNRTVTALFTTNDDALGCALGLVETFGEKGFTVALHGGDISYDDRLLPHVTVGDEGFCEAMLRLGISQECKIVASQSVLDAQHVFCGCLSRLLGTLCTPLVPDPLSVWEIFAADPIDLRNLKSSTSESWRKTLDASTDAAEAASLLSHSAAFGTGTTLVDVPLAKKLEILSATKDTRCIRTYAMVLMSGDGHVAPTKGQQEMNPEDVQVSLGSEDFEAPISVAL